MHFSLGVITTENNLADVEKMVEAYRDGGQSFYIPVSTQESFIEEQRELFREYLRSEDYERYLRGHILNSEMDVIFKDLEKSVRMDDNEFFNHLCKVLNLTDENFNNSGDYCKLVVSEQKFKMYDVGGRFSRDFKDKLGVISKTIKMRDVDFRLSPDSLAVHAEYWDRTVDKKPKPNGFKEPRVFGPSREELLKSYGTREAWCLSLAMAAPSCFVTPEGAWYEPDGFCSGGMESLAAKEIYLEKFRQAIIEYSECYLTIVDCWRE